MFGVISAFIFVTAFSLAFGTIAYMLHAYKEKMLAALLMQPIPQGERETRILVQHRRGAAAGMSRRQHGASAARWPLALAA